MTQITVDYEQLKHRCLAPIADFHSTGSVVETRDGIYIHKDNGSSILAVAHLDSVQDADHFYSLVIQNREIVLTPSLDDRLGAYTILDLLPSLGIKVDTLLTEGEERGMSTAGFFTTDKRYNWIVEFDRTGTDVVMYDYDSPGIRKLLRNCGITIGTGTFTDICDLQHLGVKAFNFGVGYYNYHSVWSYCDIADYTHMVGKFMQFHKRYSKLMLPHKKQPKSWYGGYTGKILQWKDGDWVPADNSQKTAYTGSTFDDDFDRYDGAYLGANKQPYKRSNKDDKWYERPYRCPECQAYLKTALDEDLVLLTGMCTDCYREKNGDLPDTSNDLTVG